MILGNLNKINLSTSIFERMITGGSLYVDKTRFIENFLNSGSDVLLITRQRRLGKSLNMDTLRSFLSCQVDYRHLFEGTYIKTSPLWEMAYSAPAFIFNFRNLSQTKFRTEIVTQAVSHVYSFIDIEDLKGKAKLLCDRLLSGDIEAHAALLVLTEIAYEVTGMRSYLFIDEYDSLLINSFGTDSYEPIRRFLTDVISSAMKNNPYLQKALITGVMRISHESLFSGLNNIKIFDMFNDKVFTNDYGLTEEEAEKLCELAGKNLDDVRAWYNGVRVCGKAIYSTYSMMYYLTKDAFGCYWGRSGNLEMIMGMLTDKRRDIFTNLLNGEKITTEVETRISLKDFFLSNTDEAFFSLLVQGGYLALEKENQESNISILSIPNIELRIVWQKFILNQYFPSHPELRTLFKNANDPAEFAHDIDYFLNDRLSYHDLAAYRGEYPGRVHERIYHIFVLGILSAYSDASRKRPKSNRESGHGRYDILFEKHEANYIFEFKSAKNVKGLNRAATTALKQIDNKRYGSDLNPDKPLVKIGVAVFDKYCKVKVLLA